MRVSRNSGLILVVGLTLVLAGAAPTSAQCPDAATMRARLAEIDLTRAARSARFGRPVPAELHARALAAVGKPFSTREGQRVTGVMVAPVAAEGIWRSINDEPHHADGYLPVNYSTVVEGRPRGTDRVLFQYYARAGIGRWWASRVFINAGVYEQSGGRIWELYWRDSMHEVDRSRPEIADVDRRIRPIESSEGAWMLVPLGESCTLVEEYSRSDPGGALGVVQALVAAGALRDTLVGVVKMAREHRCRPTPDAAFYGPDGKPLGIVSAEASPIAR